MARTVVVKLTDDLDGTEATQTVQFSIGGKDFEIDLSDKNAADLDKALAKYVKAARKPEGKRSRTSSAPVQRDYDLPALREWAAEKGIKVAPRGRVAQSIVDQFKAEQASS